MFNDKNIKNNLQYYADKADDISERVCKEAETVTLCGDGSQDTHAGLHHICALTPECTLLTTKRDPTCSKDAEKLYSWLTDEKERLETVGIKIIAYIGDNCSTERKLRKLIESRWGIGTLGCGDHVFGLISEDYWKIGNNKLCLDKSNILHNRIRNSKVGDMVNENIKKREVKESILKVYPNINLEGKVCFYMFFVCFYYYNMFILSMFIRLFFFRHIKTCMQRNIKNIIKDMGYLVNHLQDRGWVIVL